MMFVLFNIKTTGVTTEPLIIRGHLSSNTVFCSLQVAQSLFYDEVPHWALFVIVVPFILTIVLSVLIGLTLLITPLVSSMCSTLTPGREV